VPLTGAFDAVLALAAATLFGCKETDECARLHKLRAQTEEVVSTARRQAALHDRLKANVKIVMPIVPQFYVFTGAGPVNLNTLAATAASLPLPLGTGGPPSVGPNLVFAGPVLVTTDPAAQLPSFRPLVVADLPLGSPLSFTGGVTVNSLVDTGLTPGNCVQAGANGLLTTIGGSCASTGLISSPVVAPNPLAFDVDLHFKGPNPYVDITRFGARACDRNATPCAGGLTANMTSGSAVATISSASTFINGDGVVVYGAGSASGLTTPTGLVVTNVLARMGTGTGLTTPSAAGSTTTCYKIIARTTGGGYTPASSEICTTTGLATRGAVTVNLTSCTRSGVQVTCTTAAPTPLLVGGLGAEAYIGGAPGSPTDSSFRGWRTVTPTDSTHFTFTDTATNSGNGAAASCTGGTVTFFAANHLSWNVVSGAWLYYIYGGAAGAETLIRVSRPQGMGQSIAITDTTFDDFGPTLMSNMSFPSWIPTTPPGVGANNNLSTTILSGAGTTTLILNANAGATVSGAGIRLDAGPGLIAAAAAANGIGPLFIPIDPSLGNFFVINSFTDLTPYLLSIVQSGTLYLRETLALRGAGLRYMGDRSTATGGAGGGGANTWGNYPKIWVVEAVPGIYLDSTFGSAMGGVFFNGIPANGVLLMLAENGFNIAFNDISWATSTGSLDRMGFGLILRGVGGQSVSGVIMDKVSFSVGTNAVDGATHNTSFFCNSCGDVTIRKAYSTGAGFIFLGNPSGGSFKVIEDHYNGGFTPFISVGGSGNMGIELGEPSLPLIMDTIGHPCVSVFFGSTDVFNNGCTPTGTIFQSPSVTGVVRFATSSFTAVGTVFNNSLSTQLQPTVSSQTNTPSLVFNVTGPGGISVGYNNDSIFVNGPPPAAPTCTVSAGGSVPIDTWFFIVQPYWWNCLEGTQSPRSTGCTTTPGNQTITVNWTTVGGNPKQYGVFAGNGGGFGGFGSGPLFPATSTSAIWSSGSVGSPISNGVQLGGPTMLLPGNQGVVAPQYLVSGSSGVAAAIVSGLGAPTGGLCTTSTGGKIYLRTDGTTTTSFYVCDGATGAWTAK